MKISIVMAYYNRKSQLRITLKTISQSDFDNKNIEIIIVDDASDNDQIIDSQLMDEFQQLNITMIRIDPVDKTYLNPCIPYNKAIKKCKGDIILIQNPEVCHIGDILMFVCNNLELGDYMTFNCYGLANMKENDIIVNKMSSGDGPCGGIKNIKQYIQTRQKKKGGNSLFSKNVGGWLN